MDYDLVPYQGRSVQLQAPNRGVLDQLRAVALNGGLEALLTGLPIAARAITVAIDVVVQGYYRVRIAIENRQVEFEIATILGMYSLFQRARDTVLNSGWDADLQQQAIQDLDRALRRRRRP
jgi:hypothetical protein